MSHTRTLVLTPTFEVVRDSLTYTNVAYFDSPGAYHFLSRSSRPAYGFHLNLEPLFRPAYEELVSFHAFHQGGKSFFYDGGPYATIDNYQLIGEGDDAKTQFYIPNRYVGANSFSLRTQNQATLATSVWLTSAYSLMPTPGILVFSSAVSSGHDLQAAWSCKYRVVFPPDGFKIAEFARNVFRAELELREVFIFT